MGLDADSHERAGCASNVRRSHRVSAMQRTAIASIDQTLLTRVGGGQAADPTAFDKFRKDAIAQTHGMAPDFVNVLKEAKCPQSEEEGEALHQKCLAAIPAIGKSMAEPKLGDGIKALFKS
jgi:hypothetical protein